MIFESAVASTRVTSSATSSSLPVWKYVASDTLPNGTSPRLAWKMRPKKASDIDISDGMSSRRGSRSLIQSFEYVLSSSACGGPIRISPSTKRNSYWLAQDAAIFGNGNVASNGCASGYRATLCSQDGRRSANTAVASVATSPPPCDSSTLQCWLERVAFTSRTSRSNGPFAIGAQ